MEHDIQLPELGEGIQTAVMAGWHYTIGEKVATGDDIAEVVTDKAVFNIPVEVSGTLCAIRAHEGEEVKVGEVIAVVKT